MICYGILLEWSVRIPQPVHRHVLCRCLGSLWIQATSHCLPLAVGAFFKRDVCILAVKKFDTNNCGNLSRVWLGGLVCLKIHNFSFHSFETFLLEYLSGSARGVSGIPVYPKKIRQNTQKYPQFIQIYPKLYPGILYTWNSSKVIYRIPVFKLQYTVYPI